jgi:hypothetical protein
MVINQKQEISKKSTLLDGKIYMQSLKKRKKIAKKVQNNNQKPKLAERQKGCL